MRSYAIAAIVAGGFGVIVATSGTSAAPGDNSALPQMAKTHSNVIQVLGNCGRGWHRNRWGQCVPGCGPGWYQPYPGAHCRLAY
jgi:hypothetical protein